jgi:hypothetical protein
MVVQWSQKATIYNVLISCPPWFSLFVVYVHLFINCLLFCWLLCSLDFVGSDRKVWVGEHGGIRSVSPLLFVFWFFLKIIPSRLIYTHVFLFLKGKLINHWELFVDVYLQYSVLINKYIVFAEENMLSFFHCTSFTSMKTLLFIPPLLFIYFCLLLFSVLISFMLA